MYDFSLLEEIKKPYVHKVIGILSAAKSKTIKKWIELVSSVVVFFCRSTSEMFEKCCMSISKYSHVYCQKHCNVDCILLSSVCRTKISQLWQMRLKVM